MCNARQSNRFPQDRIFFHQTMGPTHRTRERALWQYRKEMSDGLERFPAAFVGLMTGKALGKRVVRLSG